MEPTSLNPGEIAGDGETQMAEVGSSLGNIAAAFVRRMNDTELESSAVADLVATDLSAVLGGHVAVFLRPRGTVEHEPTMIRHHDEEGADALLPVVEQHRSEPSGATDEEAPKDFVETVFETGEVFLAPANSPDADTSESGDEPAGDDAHQLIAVPVVADDSTVGVIAAAREVAEPFSGDDLELVTRLADVTALALRAMHTAGASAAASPDERATAPPDAPSRDRRGDSGDESEGSLPAAMAMEGAADAIFLLDGEGHFQLINGATERLLGYSDNDLIGRALQDIVAQGPASRRSTDITEITRSLTTALPALYEVELRRDDGDLIHVELSVAAVSPGEGDLFVAVARDVSGRKRSEERLRQAANTDPLTGLLNRASLHRALGRSMRRVDEGHELAVLFLDLDGFKAVNDNHGHQAGDEVLRTVAERLTHSVRRDDLVARYGGDEFVVVLEAEQSIEREVEAVRERIADAFERPVRIGDTHQTVRVSIGEAIHGRDGTSISQLVAHADTQMYRDKQSAAPGAATPGPAAPLATSET